jgi:putative endonuclease
MRLEGYALNLLRKAGLRLVLKNFQCRMGEIDLIMWDGDTLVFVEVRYRQDKSHGSAIETITQQKQRKILRTARLYLQQQALYDKVPCRIDVVGLTGNPGKPDFDWIKNAFMCK